MSFTKGARHNGITQSDASQAIHAGLSILPEPMVRAEIASGSRVAIRLSGCDLERPIAIIHGHGKSFTPVLRRLVEALCEQAMPKQDNEKAIKR